jgi:hypothetical protein
LAHDYEPVLKDDDKRRLGAGARSLGLTAIVVGLVALAAAVLVSRWRDGGWELFGYAYVTNYAFFLSITLGGLFIVLATHLFRAGWVVAVRRIAEVIAANMPVMAVLFIPILLFVWMGDGVLYPWAAKSFDNPDAAGQHGTADPTEPADVRIVTVADQADAPGEAAGPEPGGHAGAPAHDDQALHTTEAEGGRAALAIGGAHSGVALVDSRKEHHEALVNALVPGKRPYLTRWFFTLRWAIYLSIWCGLGLYYLKTSTAQESGNGARLTRKMEVLAAPGTLLFALTLTFAAFDLLMTLDPVWFSTMWGVYYFAGAVLAAISTVILSLMALQRSGYLPSVSAEHYHDLGKLLFTFVFFWGYIAFSQFMLIWYGALAEETYWFELRGVTTETGSPYNSGWTYVALVLLFGHLLIPFVLLLPRWVKRSRRLLTFWAVWMLTMHWVDQWWVVMPNYSTPDPSLPVVELLCLVGIGGVAVGGAVLRATGQGLIAAGDPRLGDSLGHVNPF